MKQAAILLILILIPLSLQSQTQLYGWGNNFYGQIGIGDTWTPKQIGNDNDWRTVSCGFAHTVGIKNDGTLWAWGRNDVGQLGDGTKKDKLTPVIISEETDWLKVSCSDKSSFALKEDGTLWGWGDVFYGYSGDYPDTSHIIPVQIGYDSDWKFIDYTLYSSSLIGIKNDGTLWMFSLESFGGNDNTKPYMYNEPEQFLSEYDYHWKEVISEYLSVRLFLLRSDNTIWAYGSGVLGNGENTSSLKRKLIQVGDDNDWAQISLLRGAFHSIKTDGTLWTWGGTIDGMLGIGEVKSQYEPIKVNEDKDWKMIDKGYDFSIALKTDGSLWAWGSNQSGQYGDNKKKEWDIPKKIGDYDFEYISCGLNFVVGIKRDGTLWAWGDNYSGQIGIGINQRTDVPLVVSEDNVWRSVHSGSFHTLAMKMDGTLWAWGNNTLGQYGNGTNISSTFPIEVNNDKDWLQISVGYYHTIALKTDGTLWAWGDNTHGRLGIGSWESTNIPTQIGNENDWVYVNANISHSIAIKTDGTLWAWGKNEEGQLGTGYEVMFMSSNTPVLVKDETGWQKVACCGRHSLGIKHDGTLWVWGSNQWAQFGRDSPYITSYVPLKVNNDTDWKDISCGFGHSMALKHNGTLWGWGLNEVGQVGDGWSRYVDLLPLDDVLTPYKIGDDYIYVDAGSAHTIAIKGDYSLWGWGINDKSQLGDPMSGFEWKHRFPFIPFESKPQRIGNSNYWKSISTTAEHVMALYSTEVSVEKEILENKVISLYPNPTRDILHIRTDELIARAELSDVLGNVVKAHTSDVFETSDVLKINIENLPPGMYFLKLYTMSGEVLVEKVLVGF
jgi:alpha-tubulin suppressor-like RCC1 family protein